MCSKSLRLEKGGNSKGEVDHVGQTGRTVPCNRQRRADASLGVLLIKRWPPPSEIDVHAVFVP